ncbi:M42 family metallopeptidase [Clostridium rectalis]|uniref:M42 family metallopeptidase n=1 Tax=Clostridium rectalis TaxID=2040295 RepID=UPI000F630FF3|nr:M42 family peptidase [Clostridium rectalis]
MFLETLSNASSPSGYEGNVRRLIKEEIEQFVDEIFIDKVGNLIAHKKGTGNKVLLTTHMDENGFIITGYNEDGTLKFYPLGDIDKKIVPAKVVLVGINKIPGVIGVKPIHLQGKTERGKIMSLEDCCIDIGSNSKEETKEIVNLGDFVVFDTKCGRFGSNFVKGKALSSRLGCSILIEILMKNYFCDLYVAFNVQKEVGNRGAYISTFNIEPDINIIVDSTSAMDIPNIKEHYVGNKIGFGPVIAIKNKLNIFDTNLSADIVKVAEDKSIIYQIENNKITKNQGEAIQMVNEGTRVASISIPCRYKNTNISVASIEDYNNTAKLIDEYIKTIK